MLRCHIWTLCAVYACKITRGYNMKKLYIIATALVILLSMSLSATALDYKMISRQNGVSADAAWMDETETSYTYISVTESKDGTDIYLYTYDPDSETYIDGYTFTQKDVFDADKKLSAATLDSVTIDLYKWYCDEEGNCWREDAGEATIEANWEGIGKLNKGSYSYMSKSSDFIYKASDKTNYRDSVAEGSIEMDGKSQDLGTSQYGAIVAFKSAYMEMNK
jgi:IMP cyclohydrolase